MSDISSQQLDELIRTLDKTAGSMTKVVDKYSSSGSGRSNAKNTLDNDLGTSKKKYISSLDEAGGAIRSLQKGFKDVIATTAEFAAVGFVFDSIVKYAKANVDTYRELSKYGESFGGSMIKMSASAAAAGIPIKDFADAIRKNSVIVKQVGVDSFFKLNQQARNLSLQFGNYGLSVSDTIDIQAAYLEQQRLAGKNLSSLSKPETAKKIDEFAFNLTSLAEATGKSVDEILKVSQTILTDPLVAATERINLSQGLGQLNDAVAKATTTLVALPGGDVLGKGLADAFGSAGGSIFTDLGKELVGVGRGDLVSVIDEANRKIAAGGDASQIAFDLNNKFAAELQNPQTLESLRVLATGGNQAAKQVLAYASQLKVMSKADLDRAKLTKKSEDDFTAFATTIGSILDQLKGTFVDSLLEPLKNLGGQGGFQGLSKEILDLKPVISDLGTQFGTFITNFLKPENIRTLEDDVGKLVGVVGGIITFGLLIGKTLGPIVSAVAKTLDGIYKGGNKLVNGLGTFLAALTAITVWFGGKFLINAIKGFFAKQFINAKLVTVSGKIVEVSGGGIGGGLGGGGGGTLGKVEKEGEALAKGEMAAAKVAKGSKLLPAAGAVGKMLEAGAKTAAGAAKIGGKLFGAFLPVADIAIGAASALQAHKEGNNLAAGLYGAGAGLGGVATTLDATGVGAAVGVPVGILGGIVNALGLGADLLGIGKSKPPQEKAEDEKAMPTQGNAAPNSGSPSASLTSNEISSLAYAADGGRSPSGIPEIDDEKLMDLKIQALKGDDTANELLKKVAAGLDNHTLVIASLLMKNNQAVQGTTAAVKSQQGMTP